MFDACPVHLKGTMVIPMLWRISGYVVCMMGVKIENHHTHPYKRGGRFSTPQKSNGKRKTKTSLLLHTAAGGRHHAITMPLSVAKISGGGDRSSSV